MRQLCQFNLQLAFMRSCTLRKDVQDQSCSRQNAAGQCLLEIALLTGAQRVIKDHQLGFMLVTSVENFLQLPLTHKRARVRSSARTCYCRNWLSTCRRHQLLELVQTEVTALA